MINVNQTNNGVIEKYCYNDSIANCDEYGGLYQWAEMMQYVTDTAIQGICPAGWHLPTDGEWTILTNHLGGENVAGGKMKEMGTTHWDPPNTAATNESVFTALPGGYNSAPSHSAFLGSRASFWSSSLCSYFNAWSREMYHDGGYVFRKSCSRQEGLSVRCLKD